MSFILDNLGLIFTILIMIVNIITMIITISKSPKEFAQFLVSTLERLPDFIQEAESLGFISGEAKKTYVIKQCMSFLVSITGWSSAKVTNIFTAAISSAIENILSCPQKKGA